MRLHLNAAGRGARDPSRVRGVGRCVDNEPSLTHHYHHLCHYERVRQGT